ncbi:MAG: riboflavin synthase [Desulfitobacteriaceae bacterium]|nr:riboflavin synthase [Desulfitobacteriaceae bacterium]MDD4346600.1 riboflavin synthase [Desulfitobacteriaceae bacterium]MDD4400992.1 riboflavin synthase [Desulfitobacteriaceae bacterium]
MFTGIIEELGVVTNIRLLPDSAELSIRAEKALEETKLGDSIAVNGVCLTVIRLDLREFTVDVMAETLAKTSLAQLKPGSKVNLERALQLSSRLGGHLVSGHVDSVGTIKRITVQGIASVYEIGLPPSLSSFVLPKGSIAIDGISLTVSQASNDSFSVSLIPHTFSHTTLGLKKVGDKVNLETDMIGKYVASFLGNFNRQTEDKLSRNFLAQHGFV